MVFGGDERSYPYASVCAQVSNIVGADQRLFLKIEGLNPAGSIKLKPALWLVRQLERDGKIGENGGIIDTTSGNMGVALAYVCRTRGYRFVCVTDEKATEVNRHLIATYGGQLVVMPKSTLDERYERIAAIVSGDQALVCTRQFYSPLNPEAHRLTTAKEILESGVEPDFVYIGVGTGGTLVGCSQAFQAAGVDSKIVAVDAEGSNHFAAPPVATVRKIPGIGSTKRSPFLDAAAISRTEIVHERDAVAACRLVLQRTGWLLGGSSGSVLAAVIRTCASLPNDAKILAVCADMGERYLDTIYNDDWVSHHMA